MRFNIGPIIWDVELVSEPILHRGHQCWGTCNPREHKILIWDRASPRMRLVTLIHELTHAWVDAIGLPGHGEERLCRFVGTIMTQFILDVCRQKMQMCRFVTKRPGRVVTQMVGQGSQFVRTDPRSQQRGGVHA